MRSGEILHIHFSRKKTVHKNVYEIFCIEEPKDGTTIESTRKPNFLISRRSNYCLRVKKKTEKKMLFKLPGEAFL